MGDTGTSFAPIQSAVDYTEDDAMADVSRIPVEEAHRKVTAGQALLVCAYDDETKCNKIKLEGAIPLKSFESTVSTLPKTQEIVFYCA
jgi:hypothetical protein